MDRPSSSKRTSPEPDPSRPSWWVVPPDQFMDAHRQWLATLPQPTACYARPHGKDA
jgi:hypothetical protein